MLRGLRRRFVLELALAISFALAFGSRPASANGRFPAANAVFISPSDPQLVLARVTFGLLLSHDGGKSWAWLCERALGSTGTEDPEYAVLADGTLVAATVVGVRYSTDRGCRWSDGSGTRGSIVVDVASGRTAPDRLFSLLSAYSGQDDAGELLFKNQLLETNDGARTFTPVGDPLDPRMVAYTLETAASEPERVYVSAVSDPSAPSRKGYLLTSTNGGRRFTKRLLALTGTERAPYVAAVDPVNAKRLYVRTSNAPDAPSRLLVSDDGGETFRTVFTSTTPLLGFALSPDGSKVYVGGATDGLHIASTRDFAFEKKSSVQVQCLTATAAGVWVCSNEVSGFILAKTTDDGATFGSQLHFADLPGPLACPPDSPAIRECAKEWAGQKRALGERPDAATSDAAPSAPTGPPSASDVPVDSASAVSRRGWLAGIGVAVAALVAGAIAVSRRRRS